MGYFDRCHLLESGEALSALWIARYLPSGDERKRTLGLMGRLVRPIPQQRREGSLPYTWSVTYIPQ
jgi:hypothetical protein